MKAKAKLFVGAAVLIFIGIVFGLVVSANFGFFKTSHAQDIKISKESVDILAKTDQAMAELAAAVKPLVVNISSQRTMITQPFASPFFDDPFFRRFFGESPGSSNRPRKYKQMGLGSGVIVGKEGYVITNNHVIEGSDEITVKLSDKRQFKGKVIGADPKTDLAVVKINAHNLPTMNLGDSDQLKVGDRVIAIGNPFGLNQTITSGIISATGRADVGIADYEDFIQTDAAINPGNSGGALVNTKGELIGINTAIATTSGGYQGVGFAIPSNMVKAVMESLIKKGKVIRGWLGITIQPVTSVLAKQFGLKSEKGVVVSDVIDDSPAKKAGIQQGDVIIEFDGKEIKDASQLKNAVANISPGKEINVKIIRDGKEKTLPVIVEEMPAKLSVAAGEFENQLKGVHVQNLTPEAKKLLGLPSRIKGVIVTGIEEGSPADGVLNGNDVILEINKKRIENTKDYNAIAGSIKSDESVLLLVYRNGSSFYITLSNQ